MIHIDSKITIWDRFSIDDEHKDALMEFLGKNPGTTASEIVTWASVNGIDGEHDTLIDTGVEMTPEENDGASTIEVHLDHGIGTECIWENAPVVTPAGESVKLETFIIRILREVYEHETAVTEAFVKLSERLSAEFIAATAES